MRGTLLVILLTLGCMGGPQEISIANWPDGHKSAVAITFDTELADSAQIERIANALGGTNATFFVVTGYFTDRPGDLEPLRGYEVASMAWKQGKWEYNERTLQFQKEEMQIADSWLREKGFEPRGFRAPLLLSNNDTIKAAGELGYVYDSSVYYGSLPYRTDGVIEMPLAVNFDVYWSENSKEQATLPFYLAFEDTYKKDGLFTFYSHVDTASENVDEFIDFIDYAKARQVWLVSAGEAVDWWLKRENLELRLEGDLIIVKNTGDESVKGATVKISPKRAFVEGAVSSWEDDTSTYAILPTIEAGGEVSVL